MRLTSKAGRLCLLIASSFAFQCAGFAGSIFVTGHDPVWHSEFGTNTAGATMLSVTAIEFARNGSTLPFLFIESTTVSVPAGNAHEAPYLISRLGYSASDFVVADFSVLNALADFRAALNNYSAIVVASDHGGMLTGSELGFLNSHSTDIIDYVNGGGGLAAFAQSDEKGLLSATPRYQFLPFLVSSVNFQTPEVANTVTPFGASLGILDSDVNGNFSHAFFSDRGGMMPVDLYNGDPTRPLSLAFRGTLTPGGVQNPDVPEPSTISLVAAAAIVFVLRRKTRNRAAQDLRA
ncbi:MAG: PEP-CTERM sorting domain-containing protein [Bryobacteraceae bacterium]